MHRENRKIVSPRETLQLEMGTYARTQHCAQGTHGDSVTPAEMCIGGGNSMHGIGAACGCAGSGAGLDANGSPLGSDSSAPQPLVATFQSIQDNVFTPICTKCHIGANAPEGLQLDQAHSYALLVGVPSAEVPGVLRVKAGNPADSYVIQKLQGSSGIVGVQMPFGGPYLPQSTIDVIRQWITNGTPAAAAAANAVPGVAHELSHPAVLEVTATMPADGSTVTAPLGTIAVALSQQPDGLIPERRGAFTEHYHSARARSRYWSLRPRAMAEGNPATVLLTPVIPLVPGPLSGHLAWWRCHGPDLRDW